jgi:hypothetical protein
MDPKDWQWPRYYWSLCTHLGQETYRTWRWELFSSVPVGFFAAWLTGGWKDFRTGLLATALTLGCFVIWHIVRLPWLVHKSVQTAGEEEPGFLAGVFGILILAALFVGSYESAVVSWNLRPLGVIEIVTKAPPVPVIDQRRLAVVHGACKLTAEQINPARSPQPCPGSPPPTLQDRVLAINAHFTEGDRNRFSDALSEFDESLKEGETVYYKLNTEAGALQRERQDGTIAKDVQGSQKALSDIATEGWKYYRSFPALRSKWQSMFEQQTEYVFGDNPDNGGSGELINAAEGYRNYLEFWKSVQNKQDPAVLNLLSVPENEFQSRLRNYALWHASCVKRLSEMRDSIR